MIKVPNPNDGLHSRRRSVTAVALDGRVDATLDEMDAAAWTAIGLLAATSLGSLFYLGSRIDALGGRIDPVVSAWMRCRVALTPLLLVSTHSQVA